MKFKYKAKREDGSFYEAEQEALDKFALFRERKKEGETVISANEIAEARHFNFSFLFRRRVKMREQIVFARNLSGMIGAGLSLSRALSVLLRQTKDSKMKEAVGELLECVGRGMPLSSALGSFPNIFPPIIVSMVRAGEESGNITGSLRSAADVLERSYGLVRKVRGALVYPAIVVAVMAIVGILLFIFVVPQLVSAFNDLNLALPFATRVIIWLSVFFKSYGLLILAVIPVFFIVLLSALRSEKGRQAVDGVLLHIPIVSVIMKEFYAARISETLSSLISAGVPILSSIGITADVVGNYFYKESLANAEHAVERGEPIATVFSAREDLFPVFLSEMIAVGEETGNLSVALRDVGVFYEAEVEQKTKNLSVIIEPALMVVVGAAVGFFAIAMITPMYSLMNTI